jgi:transforming growth factor-beta-induced protein
MMNKFKVLTLFVVVTLFVVACAESATPTPVPTPTEMAKDIVDTAVEAGNFETLVAAVQAAGLVDALKGEGPFTVFAPTDDAFAALPEGTIDALLADPEGDLTQILLYHVVPGKVMAADVSDGLEAETLQGSKAAFSIDGDAVKIADANIVATDIETSNGVIHVIDAVILPPAGDDAGMMEKDIVDTAVEAGGFETLVAAVQAEAFAMLPEGTLETLLADPAGDLTQILLYHVIPGKVMAADVSDGLEAETLQGSKAVFSADGDAVMIGDATIVATDIETSNGVIHVIDAVILPPEM